jgi:hypothetical protein
MAKNKISEWSSTPASNTDVGGINIAEGMAPSDVNNAIREMMAQIKDQQAGLDGDNFTVGGNLTVNGSTSFGALTTTGNTVLGDASGDTLTITGTAVSAPNGLNIDSNTLVVDVTNNRVGVNSETPAVGLAVGGTDSIQVPIGTTAQRPTGADGYIRYNSDLDQFEGYSDGAWGQLGAGATGGGSDNVFFENSLTVTTNYTITAGKSASSTGDITINDGVTVTVPDGSRWVIL